MDKKYEIIKRYRMFSVKNRVIKTCELLLSLLKDPIELEELESAEYIKQVNGEWVVTNKAKRNMDYLIDLLNELITVL